MNPKDDRRRTERGQDAAQQWVDRNLPGCDEVRALDVATPQFEAPFALQAETVKKPRARQEGLFIDGNE